MKKTYIAPRIEVAGTVAGLTRGSLHGDCPDFMNPTPGRPNHTNSPRCEPGTGGGGIS